MKYRQLRLASRSSRPAQRSYKPHWQVIYYACITTAYAIYGYYVKLYAHPCAPFSGWGGAALLEKALYALTAYAISYLSTPCKASHSSTSINNFLSTVIPSSAKALARGSVSSSPGFLSVLVISIPNIFILLPPTILSTLLSLPKEKPKFLSQFGTKLVIESIFFPICRLL